MTGVRTLSATLSGRFTMVYAESGEVLPPLAAAGLADVAVAAVVEWLAAAAGLNRELTFECLCPRDHDKVAASLEQAAAVIERVR